MRKLILSILLGFSCQSFACDNCNIYLNVSPNDYKNSIGIFMRQRNMFGEYDLFGEMIATRHAGHGNDTAFWGQQVFETYQTYELRGSYFIRERWKASFVLPIINNTQTIGNTQRYRVQGVGDPTLLGSFQVFNTRRDTSSNHFTQRLTVGAGIKLPLGKTNLAYANGIPNLDLQPGSGSWDGLAYLAYAIKWRFIGLNSNVSLKVNGKDSHNYRYGKSFNSTVNLFSDIKIKRVTLRLSGGVYIEKAAFDASYYAFDQPPFIHMDTGGDILFSNAGIQLYTKHFVVFGEYQNRIKSILNGYTQLLTRNKINIGLTYNF